MVALLKCFKYKKYYSVLCELYSPILDKWFKIRFIIDSGFSGDVFLRRKIYDSLKLNLVESASPYSFSAKTIVGSIPLRASRSRIRIKDNVFDVKIYTPVFGYGENLLGRGVLEKLITILHRNKKTCIRLTS